MLKKLIYINTSKQKVLINSIFNGLLIFVGFLMFSIVLFLMSNSYYIVKGHSMEPNILPASENYAGQGCYVAPISSYTYDDVVVAKSPNNVLVVKRIVALGGDKIGFYYNVDTEFYELVRIKNNSEIIEKVNESYLTKNVPVEEINSILAKNTYSYENFCELATTFEIIEEIKFLELAENQIFLLGDNRDVSVDSSTYGPINKSDLFGKVSIVVERNDWHLISILKYMFF